MDIEMFTTFSRAVSRCMGVAMICLAWMISAVLYWLPVQRRCYSVEQENSLKPLCKAIVHSRSWVGNSVNTFRTKTEHKKKERKEKNCRSAYWKKNIPLQWYLMSESFSVFRENKSVGPNKEKWPIPVISVSDTKDFLSFCEIWPNIVMTHIMNIELTHIVMH